MKKIFAYIFLLLFTPAFVDAAALVVENFPNTVRPGDKFKTVLTLNTDRESVNAVEGDITFPALLELDDIRSGNSLINFWVEEPESQNNRVHFSGITPGGFVSEKGLVFELVFKAKSEGKGRIGIANAKVYKNDGVGTEAAVTLTPADFTVSQNAQESTIEPLQDKASPEKFSINLAKDPGVFEGKWFITFATQDKGSGVDYYEVKEGRGDFIQASSPYELKNQELRDTITVRAVDNAGNVRTEKLLGPNAPWYKKYGIFVIILLLLVFFTFGHKYFIKKTN